MIRFEHPRTANEVQTQTDPNDMVVEITNPIAWVRQLIRQHQQAQDDLQTLYEMCGDQFDRQDRRLRRIETNYTVLYESARYLHEQLGKEQRISADWLQTELTAAANAYQVFARDTWAAIEARTTDQAQKTQNHEMQLIRHQDALCFIQGANLARDNNALAFQQEVGAWAGGVNARADKVEKDLEKTRLEFATALKELTKAKEEIKRLASLTAIPPVEPAATIRPLPRSISSLGIYELTPEDLEMHDALPEKPSRKVRPTAIEVIEPEVEYTPLSNKAVESMEGWLAERAAIRERNEKIRKQARKQPEVPIGRLGAPETGPSGIARKKGARREEPLFTRQEIFDRWEKEKDLVYGSLAGDQGDEGNGGNGGNGGNNDLPPPPSPSLEPTPEERHRQREMRELAELIAVASRTHLPPPPQERVAKITPQKPPTFDGKPATPFRLWWNRVKEYFDFYPQTGDRQKIAFIGSLLTDEAQEWHQYRYQKLGNNDTAAAYWDAIQEEYVDPMEAYTNHRKLRELRYKGDIKAFLVSFKTINRHAGVNGTSLKEIINLALPADIISLRFSQNRGPLHNDDDFLLATEEAGRHYEELKRTLKMRTYDDGNRKVTYFGQEEKEESRERRGGKSGRKDKERDGKKEDKRRNDNPGNKDKQGPKDAAKKGVQQWSSIRDALAGIDQGDINAHKATCGKNGCWRCGLSTHRTFDCYAKRTASGTELPQPNPRISAVGSATKRKREPEPESEGPATKQPKTAAVGINDSDMREIWEIDSEEEFEQNCYAS